MNREIRFRGKSVTNGEWLYGCLLKNEEGKFAVVKPFKVNMDNECSYYEVDEDTIGQFTGLHDKNGKEIYEGDILICIGQREDNMGQKYYRKVLFNNGSFGMKIPEYNCTSSLCNHVVNGNLNWEVIGNIYDNPELLEDAL